MSIRKVSNLAVEKWSTMDFSLHSLQRQIDQIEKDMANMAQAPPPPGQPLPKNQKAELDDEEG